MEYAAEELEGEPEAPLNIPPEVDPQVSNIHSSLLNCGNGIFLSCIMSSLFHDLAGIIYLFSPHVSFFY